MLNHKLSLSQLSWRLFSGNLLHFCPILAPGPMPNTTGIFREQESQENLGAAR
jgi:hypothetical protein